MATDSPPAGIAGGKHSWPLVTAAAPCPTCQKPDRCKVSPDGRKSLCFRVEGGKATTPGGPWIHSLSADPGPDRPTDFPALAADCAARLTPGGRDRLAAELRLPPAALDPLGVGVDPAGRFSFPEADADGRVIGVLLRHANGTKRTARGSRRGLTLPAGWCGRPGPVYVVEGPTDAAAMLHAGLACVGRPSASGGGKMLAKLLADWPADRAIVVVGENDQKTAGSWPGRTGAVAVATHLAATLNRPVAVAFPPPDAKDARAWMTADGHGETPWPDRGAAFAVALEATAEPVTPPGAPADPGADRPVLPLILVGPDQGRVNDEAAKALGRADDLYHRNGALTQVIDQPTDSPAAAPVRRWAGAAIIRPAPLPLVQDRLSRCARFGRVVETKEGRAVAIIPPPGWSVAGVAAAGHWPAVRPLNGVVTHPVILADGSVLAAAGYHAPTGLLVRPTPGLVVPVPDQPDRAAVQRAVDTLVDPVRDFPFLSPAHRAAWLAGLLTPLAWHAFDGPAPLFLIDGNTRGVGKGLLADVIALAVLGRRFAVMTYTPDEDELRKRITTLVMEADRMVLLDNLAGAVGNAVFDAALTGGVWKDRVLGVTGSYTGPLDIVWYATGNNCTLQADTGRRTCHIRLETPLAEPELKADFRYPDLPAHVRANRGPLLSAALTVLRAYILAGKPDQHLTPWGSYTGWSGLVRGCLVWAGLPDPGDTRRDLQTCADLDGAAVAVLLGALARLDPRRAGLYAADIADRTRTDPDVREAVDHLTVGKGDANTLGRKLAGFKTRVFPNRLFLDTAGHTGRGTKWVARPADQFHTRPGASGSAGLFGDDGDVGADVPGHGGLPD